MNIRTWVVAEPMSDAAAFSRLGVSSMVAPLRRVVMRRPGPATFEADPNVWHYAGPLDRERLCRQYDDFTELVRADGVEIEWIPPVDDGLADSIFTYDPSMMTTEGAILLRPGKQLREPETELHRKFYERIAVPVLGAIEAPGTMEGGDCFWLDERTLAVGRGFRTNHAGVEQLGAMLARQDVTLEVFDLPDWADEDACLHLLSLVSPLDRDLALVYRPLIPVALYETLRDRGVECLEAPDDEFAASGGLNLNVLALAPRMCIALDGFPATASLMAEAGCDVALFAGDALCIPCEGGPTCMTLPILRG
jgi:N-dimethylarginine dimethylaminohydrolase